MIKLIVCGFLGRLGSAVCRLATTESDVRVVAGTDINPGEGIEFPAFKSIKDCEMSADVVVAAVPPTEESEILAIFDFAVQRNLPLIFCTTAISDEAEKALLSASDKIAVLRSPNMSVGINLLLNMLGQAARFLHNAGFDTEIIEKHHGKKLDAPSGTAIALAKALKYNENMRLVHGRSQKMAERIGYEIGIHSIRGGSIIGEHTVLFAGPGEVIEFTHKAESRDVFAIGTLQAARFIIGKTAGLYSMQDLMTD